MTPLTEEELAAINPGIRHTVQVLRSWNLNTCDSGDGETHDFECDKDNAYVVIKVPPAEIAWMANNLASRLRSECGIEFDNFPHPQDDPEGWLKYPRIDASYSPIDGYAFIHLENVIIPDTIPIL